MVAHGRNVTFRRSAGILRCRFDVRARQTQTSISRMADVLACQLFSVVCLRDTDSRLK